MKNSNFSQELTLPSRGVFNPEIPEGVVVQRCMMVQDQKYLSGASQSAGSSINQILQRTITSPEGFDVSKLTLPDTLYLLFKLKILSYGKDYKFRSKCPECGKKIDVLIDMSELPMTVIDDDYEDKLVVTLPVTGDIVYTRPLTNQDIEDIRKEDKRRQRRDSNRESSEYILRIARTIERIELAKPDEDGKKEITSQFEIERYIEDLTDLDAATITDSRDSLEYGILPVVEYVCPECGEYIDISVNFSGDFFRPYTSR